jgi:hypothetical protein
MMKTNRYSRFFIHGFRNRSLRQHLGRFRSSQISRLLKRLRLHGIIKRVGRTYKYYLVELGRHVAVAGLTLKNLFLVPEFAAAVLAPEPPNPCFSAINFGAYGLPGCHETSVKARNTLCYPAAL